jgi:hypothetical protein
MSISLHLQAKLEQVKLWLLPWLLPETRAVLMLHGAWLSVYAEQLSPDLSDIEELAVPLSQHLPVWCVVFDRQTEVYHFDKGALQNISQTPPEGIGLAELLEFEAALSLLRTGVLAGVLLEPEPEKPGMAEFFGRSRDE